MNKLEGFMEGARVKVERARAYLTVSFLRNDAADEEQTRPGSGRRVKRAAYEFSQAVRGLYFKMLEARVERHLDDATSPDELSDAIGGIEKTEVKVQTLWESLQTRINIETIVRSWLQSHGMKEKLRQNPMFTERARAYALAYLRWLLIMRLSGKSSSEAEKLNGTKEK